MEEVVPETPAVSQIGQNPVNIERSPANNFKDVRRRWNFPADVLKRISLNSGGNSPDQRLTRIRSIGPTTFLDDAEKMGSTPKKICEIEDGKVPTIDVTSGRGSFPFVQRGTRDVPHENKKRLFKSKWIPLKLVKVPRPRKSQSRHPRIPQPNERRLTKPLKASTAVSIQSPEVSSADLIDIPEGLGHSDAKPSSQNSLQKPSSGTSAPVLRTDPQTVSDHMDSDTVAASIDLTLDGGGKRKMAAPFPISCEVVFRDSKWVALGFCTICGKSFTRTERFHKFRATMLNHAGDHGFYGFWQAKLDLDDPDPKKRLIWARSTGPTGPTILVDDVEKSGIPQQNNSEVETSNFDVMDVTVDDDINWDEPVDVTDELKVADVQEVGSFNAQVATTGDQRMKASDLGSMEVTTEGERRKECDSDAVCATEESKQNPNCDETDRKGRTPEEIDALEGLVPVPQIDPEPDLGKHDSDIVFPVSCHLTLDGGGGFYLLSGRCEICDFYFPAAVLIPSQEEKMRQHVKIHFPAIEWNLKKNFKVEALGECYQWTAITEDKSGDSGDNGQPVSGGAGNHGPPARDDNERTVSNSGNNHSQPARAKKNRISGGETSLKKRHKSKQDAQGFVVAKLTAKSCHRGKRVKFPITSALSLDEKDIYVLDACCNLCDTCWHTEGSSSDKFASQDEVSLQMMAHVFENHGVGGTWQVLRNVDHSDLSQRLTFSWLENVSRSEVAEESAKHEAAKNTQTTRTPETADCVAIEEEPQDLEPPVPSKPQVAVTSNMGTKPSKPQVAVTSSIVGTNPTVNLHNQQVPRGLLPADVFVESSQVRDRREPPLQAKVFEKTLKQAATAGLEAPALWPGCGQIPEELRHGFKSLLILGSSGSGKSTLLKTITTEVFYEEDLQLYPSHEWLPNRPLIEAFKSAELGRDLLGRVGLSSVPSWCKPFEVLSVGEKYRANIARSLQNRANDPDRPLVFDEWTSELDRNLARVVNLALAKFLRQAQEGTGGPFIFASCHNDCAQFLQPEFVVVCEVGSPPRIASNPFRMREAVLPRMIASVRGNPNPWPEDLSSLLLIGSWSSEADGNDIVRRFREQNPARSENYFETYPCEIWIKVKGSKEENVFEIMSKLSRVPWLRIECGSAHEWNEFPSPWFYGALVPLPLETERKSLRLRLISPHEILVEYFNAGARKDYQSVRFTRVNKPSAAQMLFLSGEWQEAIRNFCLPTGGLTYDNLKLPVLRKHGWYIPPDFTDGDLYNGLVSVGDGWKDNLEESGDHPYYLASYVGEPDGSLCQKLNAVSRLLDLPFDGLCVHKVPKMPRPTMFTVGVITGPSGSGKTSLAHKLWRGSPVVEWSESVPVLGHFKSLDIANEFISAVCLDHNVAMRPFHVLSGGEKTRAEVARQLAACADRKNAVCVLEEFTSTVDRRTSRRMANGIQNLANKKHIAVVMISCHNDFIRKGLLAPDWVFETRGGRLINFNSTREDRQRDLKNATSALCQARLLLAGFEYQVSKTRFSETFRNEALAFLGGVGQEELNRLEEEFKSMAADNEPELQAFPEPEMQSLPEIEEIIPSNLLAQPSIELEVRRALPQEWIHFREHHYKDRTIKGDTVVFLGILDGVVAGFCGIVCEPFNSIHRGIFTGLKLWCDLDYPEAFANQPSRRLFREHRTVVLPDFQGMGLGPLLCDAVAAYILSAGFDFTSQTVHPFYGSYRDRSPMWRALPTNRTALKGNLKYSHVFVGAYRRDGSVDPDIERQMGERVQIEMVAQRERVEQNDDIVDLEKSAEIMTNDCLAGKPDHIAIGQNDGSLDVAQDGCASNHVDNLVTLDGLEHCAGGQILEPLNADAADRAGGQTEFVLKKIDRGRPEGGRSDYNRNGPGESNVGSTTENDRGETVIIDDSCLTGANGNIKTCVGYGHEGNMVGQHEFDHTIEDLDIDQNGEGRAIIDGRSLMDVDGRSVCNLDVCENKGNFVEQQGFEQNHQSFDVDQHEDDQMLDDDSDISDEQLDFFFRTNFERASCSEEDGTQSI